MCHYVNCFWCMQPQERKHGLLSRDGAWFTQERSVFLFNCVCSVSATQVFLSWTFSSALSQEKHTSKTFTCILGFVLQCYMTKLGILFSSPQSLSPTTFFFFFFGGGSFIFLWYWKFVDKSLLICCVFSSYPSPHYSSPFTQFKSFRY